MIEEKELELARKVLEFASSEGAAGCRVVLSKSTSDLLDTLNGELDKVTHCLDKSLSLSLLIDGRFATFSTNRLEESELAEFVHTCAKVTVMLEKDACRALPSADRCAKNALTGRELGLYDDSYALLDSDRRKELALAHCLDLNAKREGYAVISEEGQYGDSEFDSVTLDSNGLFCRHCETSFEYASEVTIEAADGSKYSNYHWTSSPFLKDFKYAEVGEEALRRAVSQIGSHPVRSGKHTMVVSENVASKLVTPLLSALNGYSIQQNNSFLTGSLGKKLFSDRLTIVDRPLIPGESGSRLFDSEGVATGDLDIIREGEVKTYFINTYIANKLGVTPTVEDSTRACLCPTEPGLSLEGLLARCGRGILVTGFNGGNCNSATGDFSYGVEGFEFSGGKITSPVSEMLITGNFLTLWANFLGSADDARRCASKLIPSLAFGKVDFSGE